LDVRADWAERTLPEIVDTITNAGLLTTLAIDAQSLTPVEAASPDPARTDVTSQDE
jgi:hypothetical protein